MNFYLPIAEIEINIFILFSSGFFVGLMSGLFGVGGGFLMTPLLIFLGIPPATAVGTEATQILGSSVSGAIAHGRNRNIDFEMGLFLLIGGIFGSTLGVIFFKFMRESGNIDLIISLLYIIFLAIIGSLMFIESAFSMFQKDEAKIKKKKVNRNILHRLPLKFKFRRSRLYVSILIPVGIGVFVGILSALMGIGGGFVMVPAMIYLLGMQTITAIGTSLFQIVFVTANVTFLQATYNQSVDLVLAIFLLLGGVIGAQIGSKYTAKFEGNQLRILLASLVILVCFKMSFDLIQEPNINSRIIIQESH